PAVDFSLAQTSSRCRGTIRRSTATPELQNIGAPQSNYFRVSRIACDEKGVTYNPVPVMPHTAEVDAVHPPGKIPALRHGDVTLAESRAICFYIVFYLHHLPESGAIARRKTNLEGYYESHMARASVKDALPPPFPGRSSWAIER